VSCFEIFAGHFFTEHARLIRRFAGHILIDKISIICFCSMFGEIFFVSTFAKFSDNQVANWISSGVIGFLLCAKEGHAVNFLTPVNPIEKIEGATKAGRELRFYNSEVCLVYFIVLATCLCENPSPHLLGKLTYTPQ
jgi:hypothetical protein